MKSPTRLSLKPVHCHSQTHLYRGLCPFIQHQKTLITHAAVIDIPPTTRIPHTIISYAAGSRPWRLHGCVLNVSSTMQLTCTVRRAGLICSHFWIYSRFFSDKVAIRLITGNPCVTSETSMKIAVGGLLQLGFNISKVHEPRPASCSRCESVQ